VPSEMSVMLLSVRQEWGKSWVNRRTGGQRCGKSSVWWKIADAVLVILSRRMEEDF